MTQQEIFEYNKLCAEFLGAQCLSPNTKYSYFDFGEDWDFNYPFLLQQKVHNNMLYFHSDWNWIMAVVEHIEKLKNPFCTVQIEQEMCCIHVGGIDFKHVSNKKEAVVQAIDSFLKFYNKNLEMSK